MIPFPRIHIATSVLNRIQNTLEDKQSPLALMPAPIPPDPSVLGLQIDEQTTAPLEPTAPIDPMTQEGAMLDESLLGGSLFGGALLGR